MAVMAVGLIACGTDKSDNESIKEEKTSVTITSFDASKNEIELEVPYNPAKIADDMNMLLESLSEKETTGLLEQIAHLEEDVTKY